MNSNFAEALIPKRPFSGSEEELALFSWFEGSWELDIVWYSDGKAARESSGEWHFSPILDGRAMQDVWIAPSRRDQQEGAELYEYGTSVRFYDPAIQAWRSTWMGPVRGVVITFLARPVDGEIVLEGREENGNRLRWIFSNITESTFSWRNELAIPGGSFSVQQTFEARRVQAG